MLTCALVCNPLQKSMATAGKTVESQADQEMEAEELVRAAAEEQIGFLGMFERV